MAALRAELLATITPRELAAVVRAMLKAGKAGDVAAAGLVLRWSLGEPTPLDVLERLEQVEAKLGRNNRCP